MRLYTYHVDTPTALNVTVKAHSVAIEDGVLLFYIRLVPGADAELVRAFAPGCWTSVTADTDATGEG